MSDVTPDAAISIIKAMQPDPSRRVYREQGYTACKFSELCAWKGYNNARWMTEFMLERVPDLPQDCLLFTTFRAFLATEHHILQNGTTATHECPDANHPG